MAIILPKDVMYFNTSYGEKQVYETLEEMAILYGENQILQFSIDKKEY